MSAPLIIDLWFWPLTEAQGAALSEDEEARAARFLRPGDATAYRAARGGLRRVLAGYMGAAPGDLRFDYGAQGKPALDGGPGFNLSHAGGWAALAVCETPGAAPGIDIEAHREVETDVAKRFFSRREQAALAGLTGRDWKRAFFRLWTRKEALVKALGTGLSLRLDAFDVTAGETPRLTRIEGDTPADWTLVDLAPGAGAGAGAAMEGALAIRAGGAPVTTRLRQGQLPLVAG